MATSSPDLKQKLEDTKRLDELNKQIKDLSERIEREQKGTKERSDKTIPGLQKDKETLGTTIRIARQLNQTNPDPGFNLQAFTLDIVKLLDSLDANIRESNEVLNKSRLWIEARTSELNHLESERDAIRRRLNTASNGVSNGSGAASAATPKPATPVGPPGGPAVSSSASTPPALTFVQEQQQRLAALAGTAQAKKEHKGPSPTKRA